METSYLDLQFMHGIDLISTMGLIQYKDAILPV